MKHRNKRLATLSLTTILLSGLVACGEAAGESSSGADEKLVPVKMMLFQGQAYRLPIVVADKEGIFADHGIDVELIDQPSGLTGGQSMKATKADVSHISAATLLPAWQAGDEFPYFCGGIDVLQTSLVAATNSDLPSTEAGASWEEVLQSLEGKKIGIQTPVGSGLQLLFAEALASAGVTDVTYVNMGATTTTVKAALENGSIDVAQINPPGTQMLEAAGYGKRLVYLPDGPSVYADYWGSGLVAQREWLEQEPRVAAAFCDATQEALDFITDSANVEASAKMLSEDTGIPMDASKLVVENVYSDFSAELPAESTLTRTLDGYVDLGIIKPNPMPAFNELVMPPAG